MRVVELLREGVMRLGGAGVENAELEVELLLGACLHKNRAGLFLAAKEEVGSEAVVCFQKFLDRRVRREPVAYILGEKEFWSLPFWVTPDVLIPRPETEFLLETVLRKRNVAAPPGAVFDLCCGSGIIAIVLALELQRDVVALDLSVSALTVAKKNAARHNVASRVQFVGADLLSAIALQPKISLLVSNPPYVSEVEIRAGLQPEVICFEPHLALNGGREGLEIIKRICRLLPLMLCPGGDCFLEIGADQGAAVLELLNEREVAPSFEQVEIVQDYTGRDRVAHVRMKPE